MPESKTAPRFTDKGRLYLATVIASGIGAVAMSLYASVLEPLPYQWYLLAALTLVSGSATVTLPTVGASISVSETFVFASVLLFGPSAGTLTVALDGLVISFWMAKRRPEWYRVLFNMAAPAISIWVAAQLLFAIAGIGPVFGRTAPVNTLLLPLSLFALVYFGLNSWLIAFAVALESRLSPYTIWRQNFLWLSLNYFSGASVALLLVAYSSDVDLRFIGVIVPLLLVLYLTFKTTMGRVEDANTHVKQLNRLYLSTIETLAMAIDAKDQVTHGHIRRVQQYAVGLAREIGVSDDNLLKAIEAAALLHDMGKLAVPEYILNKPGKLTAAEFEKMKLHATVGADILAAIEFPYPVVPIVRHHHENWDGSGYPVGLKGMDIPIGARILSVVDCFDALISDRPYRARLSDDEALAILTERRGSMYDPLIVDTFLRVYKEIAPDSFSDRLQRDALNEITNSVQTIADQGSADRNELPANSDEISTLYELARALAGHLSIGAAGDIIAKHLHRLIPSTLYAFFLYDAATDQLVAVHAVGDGANIVRDLRIPLGQRLSGWVAANRRTIMNSDPSLDLGDAARSSSLRLRACISAPLHIKDELVGVLTIYSSEQNSFTDEHRRLIEAVSPQIAQAFKTSKAMDVGLNDRAISLPDFEQLHQFVATIGFSPHFQNHPFTLLFIEIIKATRHTRHEAQNSDDLLGHVAEQVSIALRGADILFRYRNRSLVVLLNEAEADSAQIVSSRIRDSVHKHPFRTSTEQYDIHVAINSASAPQDGDSLAHLLDYAKSCVLQPPSEPTRDGSVIH